MAHEPNWRASVLPDNLPREEKTRGVVIFLEAHEDTRFTRRLELAVKPAEETYHHCRAGTAGSKQAA